MKYDLMKGCLCWFWNVEKANPKLGILADYYQDEEFPEQTTFYELGGNLYKNCEPAKYKEVQFYEENPMRQVFLSAKEKAEQEIIDAIAEYFKEAKENYKGEFPNYVEAMRNDHEHVACGQDDRVVRAIENYMELL